jgi:hypothetical protein
MLYYYFTEQADNEKIPPIGDILCIENVHTGREVKYPHITPGYIYAPSNSVYDGTWIIKERRSAKQPLIITNPPWVREG